MKLNEILSFYPEICREDIIYILRYKYKIRIDEIVLNKDLDIQFYKIEQDIHQIKAKKPLQYIVGNQNFMGFDICVGEGVLIPRPETEILVDSMKNLNLQGKKVLDLCCGSAAIGIAISKLYFADITSVDISDKALDYARLNQKINNAKIKIVKSDLFNNIFEKFYMIVANPPYIATEEVKKLDATVKDYEPLLALDGGIDGLDFYRKIIDKAPSYLESEGVIYFEIGHDQAYDVSKLLEKDFYDIEVIKDLRGRDRIVRAFFRRKNV